MSYNIPAVLPQSRRVPSERKMRVHSDRRSKVPSERRTLKPSQISIFPNNVRGVVIDLSAFKGSDRQAILNKSFFIV